MISCKYCAEEIEGEPRWTVTDAAGNQFFFDSAYHAYRWFHARLEQGESVLPREARRKGLDLPRR